MKNKQQREKIRCVWYYAIKEIARSRGLEKLTYDQKNCVLCHDGYPIKYDCIFYESKIYNNGEKNEK